MKILILHNKYKVLGGEDSVVLNESALLKQFGHKVEIVYFDNSDILELKQRIFTGLNAIYNRSSKHKIQAVINYFKPDVIHVHNTFPKISPSIFYLADKNKIPIVQTIHNYRIICPGALLLREKKVCEECVNNKFAYKGVFYKCYRNSRIESATVATINMVHNTIGTWGRKVDRFIVLTDSVKQKFKNSSLKVNTSQFTIKPHFVQDKGYDHDRDNGFLFVGRLSTEKGIDVLLEAFSNTPHSLTIIGEGALKKKVIDYASKYQNIDYLGLQSSKVVIEKMKACKALIVPSICEEVFGLSNIEAFSTGCPVIASNIGAMKELIKHNENGLHFEVGNSRDLIKKLDLITGNMSLNARKSYLDNYTPEKNYTQLIDIYQKVIDEKKDKLC